MKKRKAFTLVELLVVIAILAILASVTTVGYLGFTKKAKISNDNTLVAQLNTLIDAHNVNNNEFYLDDLETLFKDNLGLSLDELEPQSAAYGNHFWFDETNQEVILSTSNSLSPQTTSKNKKSALSFSENSNDLRASLVDGYYLLDGKGSPLADAVSSYHKVNSDESFSYLDETIKKVEKEESADLYSKLYDMFSTTAFFTNEHVLSKQTSSHENKFYVFPEGLETISSTYRYYSNENENSSRIFNNSAPSNYCFTDPEIVIPNSITKIESFAFYVSNDATLPTLLWNIGEDELSKRVHASATNLDIKLTSTESTNNSYYKIEDEYLYLCKENEESTIKEDLVYSHKPESLTIGVDESDKIKMISNELYVAEDIESSSFQLKANFTNDEVSSKEVDWSVNNEKVQIDNEGIVNFQALDLNTDSFTVTATSKINTAATQTMKVNIYRLKDATIEIDNKQIHFSEENYPLNITLGENTKELPISVSQKYNYENVAGLKIDQELTMTTEGDVFSLEGNNIKLNHSGSQVLHLKLGRKFTLDLTINVCENFFESKLPSKGFTYKVGTSSLELGDLFQLSDDASTAYLPSEIGLEIYNNSNNQYITPDSIYCSYNAKVDKNNWSTSEIKFTSEANENKYKIKFGNTEQVVEVVEGTNVSSFAEFTKASGNIILLSDITYDNIERDTALVLSNSKLYGNDFTIHAEGFYNPNKSNSSSFIGMSGDAVVDNVRLIGSIYPEYAFSKSVSFCFGIAVTSGTNNQINNSYIANFDAPVRAYNSGLTMNNTTLYGGALANLYIINKDEQQPRTITLNNVTTVQEILTSNFENTNNIVYGAGIYLDEDTYKLTLNVTGDFKQYNWVTKAQADQYLPSEYKSAFDSLYRRYSKNVVYNYQSSEYMNAGIILKHQFLNNSTNCSFNISANPTYKPQNINDKFLGVGFRITYYMPTSLDTNLINYPGYTTQAK